MSLAEAIRGFYTSHDAATYLDEREHTPNRWTAFKRFFTTNTTGKCADCKSDIVFIPIAIGLYENQWWIGAEPCPARL